MWLDGGVNKFCASKTLCVHLEQINASQNCLNGASTTLLTTIGLGCLAYGDTYTIRVEHPEFKRLQDGILSELKVTTKDDTGRVLDNHSLPIHISPEIIAWNLLLQYEYLWI